MVLQDKAIKTDLKINLNKTHFVILYQKIIYQLLKATSTILLRFILSKERKNYKEEATKNKNNSKIE